MEKFDATQGETLAQSFLGERVALASSSPVGSGEIQTWVSLGRKPANRAVIFLDSANDCAVVTNRNWTEFERALKLIQASALGTSDLIEVFCHASPGRMNALKERRQVLDKYQHIWHEPISEDGKVEFFCEDLRKGNVEFVTIQPDSPCLHRKVIGPGRRLPRR
ncbi:MAG: hypothetical protein ACI8W8_001430 [Rhodothermales bacterium]|jgi:hypothetical protein